VFVMIFFGFVAVCGAAYVQVGAVPTLAWWAAIPVGALATAILVVNNVRDRDTDVAAGKRTLAVRLGRGAGVAEYFALMVAAYAVPAMLVAVGLASGWALLPLATLPVAAALSRTVARTAARAAASPDAAAEAGATFNRCLAGTARLLLLYAALFAIGLAV
jgi:1,4-dihydroxy-2-naphthoate octaprenyltransferase